MKALRLLTKTAQHTTGNNSDTNFWLIMAFLIVLVVILFFVFKSDTSQ